MVLIIINLKMVYGYQLSIKNLILIQFIVLEISDCCSKLNIELLILFCMNKKYTSQ